MCEICSKLTVKTLHTHSSIVSLVDVANVNAGWVLTLDNNNSKKSN